MSKIIACYKWVTDEADIKINPDHSVDLRQAKSKISEYDKNAIQEAVKAAKCMEGKAVGLTFGDENAKPALKDALSRGLDETCWIKSRMAEDADGYVTAKVLAGAIEKLEDVNLVICAEGSSDVYARQTAPRIGAVLDWPVVTSVAKLEIKGNQIVAERKLDDCVQIVEVELPAVIAVLPEINEAPLPGLKAVLAAGKKPVIEFSAEDLGLEGLQAKRKKGALKAYVMLRKNVLFKEGTAAEKVKAFVSSLRKEGAL